MKDELKGKEELKDELQELKEEEEKGIVVGKQIKYELKEKEEMKDELQEKEELKEEEEKGILVGKKIKSELKEERSRIQGGRGE
jgi:hypothetical protein